jgi:hypothetical protein
VLVDSVDAVMYVCDGFVESIYSFAFARKCRSCCFIIKPKPAPYFHIRISTPFIKSTSPVPLGYIPPYAVCCFLLLMNLTLNFLPRLKVIVLVSPDIVV